MKYGGVGCGGVLDGDLPCLASARVLSGTRTPAEDKLRTCSMAGMAQQAAHAPQGFGFVSFLEGLPPAPLRQL